MNTGDRFAAYMVYESETEEAGETPSVADVVCLGTVEEFCARLGERAPSANLDDFATHVFGCESEDFSAWEAVRFDGYYVRGWHQAKGNPPDVWRESAYGGYEATYVLVPRKGAAG